MAKHELEVKAEAALTARKAAYDERKAVIADASLSDGEKKARVAAIDERMADLEEEARGYVVQAEMRTALAGAQTLPTGKPETEHRAGAWLAGELRAVSGGAGVGAAWTPSEYSTQWLDLMVLNSTFLSSGVSVYRTDRDSAVFPLLTADPAATSIAEAGVITVTDPSGSTITATPRKYAALGRLSREVYEDSSPSVMDMYGKSYLRALARSFDKDAYEGSGTAPAIRGLKNIAGITNLSAGANGAALANLDLIAQGIGSITAAGGEASAIVMPGRTWTGLMQIKEISGSAKPLLSESATSPAGKIERKLFGVPVYLSGTLALNETQGSSSLASSIYVYDASQVLAVVRQDARLTVDQSTYFTSDEIGVKVTMRADVIAPNPGAICRIAGVL